MSVSSRVDRGTMEHTLKDPTRVVHRGSRSRFSRLCLHMHDLGDDVVYLAELMEGYKWDYME